MNYNLLYEKWIPVLYRDGRWERVGILKAFEDACKIRQIAAGNPMDRLAVPRFLLALLYWCLGNPPDDAAENLSGPFPHDLFSKLENNKDCFNLLGDGKRFYQYRRPDPGKDSKLTADYLAQEVPTGTNIAHFRHSKDNVDGLCPACCALGLLRLPVFATSGGAGKQAGLNGPPPIYVLALGVSLAETLLLSWLPVSDLGTPAWENPEIQLPEKGEVPLLTGLTWVPRRVWLDNPEGPENACISCGRIERLIRLTEFTKVKKITYSATGWRWHDPHVVYSASKKGNVTALQTSDSLKAADAAADQWTTIVKGVLQGQESYEGKRLWIVAFSTVRNDKYLEAIEWTLPVLISSDRTQELSEKIEQWRQQSSGLSRRILKVLLAPNEKPSPRKQKGIPSIVASVHSDAQAGVYAKLGELLTGSDAAWKAAAYGYLQLMRAVAESLAPGITAAALRRRHQIRNIAPDMRSKAKAAERQSRTKGDDK